MLYLPVLFDFEHCWRNRCCCGYNVAQWTIVQEKKRNWKYKLWFSEPCVLVSQLSCVQPCGTVDQLVDSTVNLISQ